MSDKPVVPVGGGVPFDPETGERYGYLPRKAANRKLVIRAQLGLPWVLWALGAAVLLAVVAVVYVASRPDRPGPPYVDQGPLSAYAEGDVTPLRDGTGWLDRRSGLRAYAAPLAFCPENRGWVGPTLRALPVRIASGRVYVDPTHPAPASEQPVATCAAPWPLGSPRPADGR